MSLASALKAVAAQKKNDATTPATPAVSVPALRVAIQGCTHGELDKVYEEIRADEKATGKKVDLLLCCGDFEAFRNEADMQTMECPPHYRKMGDFVGYFTGKKQAPCLTIFVGGNHEASNYLFEQYYGGFVAPNIYYLGHAGCVVVGGLRIGGVSGIYAEQYRKRQYPLPPYSQQNWHGDIKDAYHTRDFEVEKLMMLPDGAGAGRAGTGTLPRLDVVMSHDWPLMITKHGDQERLLERKPWLGDEVRRNVFGNPLTLPLLHHLKPRHWFSGHMHIRFRACVNHQQDSTTSSQRPLHTDFLGLSKCFGRHGHAFPTHEFLDIQAIAPQPETVRMLGIQNAAQLRDPFSGNPVIFIDPEWAQRVICQTHHRIPLRQPVSRCDVPWVPSVAAWGSNKSPAVAAERRQREQQQQSSSSSFNCIRASDTMGLLEAIGIVETFSAPVTAQQQQQQQTTAPKKPDVVIDADGDDEEYGVGGGGDDDDDDEYDFGVDVKPTRAVNTVKPAPAPTPSAAAQQQQPVVSAGGVLQQAKEDDVGFGWEEAL